MPFHNTLFIALLLPLCVLGYLLVYRLFKTVGVIVYLLVCSIALYSLWSTEFLAILLFSLFINYFFYSAIFHYKKYSSDKVADYFLYLGVVFNLLYLCYFKYTGFLLDIVNLSADSSDAAAVFFPIGISFYTFIQIGFLLHVRASGSEQRYSIPEYFLFGSFFPYVTAGPLLTVGEFDSSIDKTRLKPSFDRMILGFTLFTFGLSKKILIADTMAPYVNEIFTANSFAEPIGFVLALLGAFGYMLQLYFDFSGYTDMALGIALLFGFYLPLNFFSPLKATNIVDFWRRWHMTMTRFFTNFVYTPLALKYTRSSVKTQKTPFQRLLLATAFPSFITFTLAGIWHGSGWNFMIFGAIHGAAISVFHIWGYFKLPKLPRFIACALTVLVFCFSLVFFKSSSPGEAIRFIGQLFAPDIAGIMENREMIYILLVAAGIAWFFPNTREILMNHTISSDEVPEGFHSRFKFKWSYSIVWVMLTSLIFIVSMLLSANGSPFIYYKF